MDALFPPVCPVCTQALPFINGRRAELCTECREKLSYIEEPHCFQCGKELEGQEQELCHDCAVHKHIFRQGMAVYAYTDVIQQSIYRFKYQNKREYAAFYAKEVERRCGIMIRHWAPDAIIPVPLHRSKYQKRGYNQSALIANELGKLMQIPVDKELLIRIKKTAPMKELNNQQRLNNLENAFLCTENGVKYKKVLIVDDIYTTGATVDACARVLMEAGVEDVYCICLCIGKGF